METRWLQDFLALADTGNFTRAAAVRNASQAAFSRRIQALEGWLGATLVDRGAYPARLTPEGVRFRTEAARILEGILTTRGELQGRPVPDRVRVALPYALATGPFPAWWAGWSAGTALSCECVLGNVHDMVSLLAAGTVDLLLCFEAAAQPVPLDPARYDRALLLADRLRPMARRGLVPQGTDPGAWPGRPGAPVPVLAYPQTVLFGRLVALAIEAAPAPLHADVRAECDMADVLRGLALAGQGAAWLPGCALRPGDEAVLEVLDAPGPGRGVRGGAAARGAPGLDAACAEGLARRAGPGAARAASPAGAAPRAGAAMDGGAWSVNVAVIALRDRTARRPALDRLWDRLSAPT